MPNQVLFQFIRWDFVPEVSKGACGSPGPRSFDVIRRWQVRPVVIQERADVKQIMNIMSERLEIARQLGRTVDVAGDDKMRWNLRASKSLLGNPASNLIEIGPDNQQRVFV
jgi:hypothetical protein